MYRATPAIAFLANYSSANTRVITFVPLQPHHADQVAALHAASWRSAYRGILTDAYLDAHVDVDRLTTWREKLRTPHDDEFGLLALRDERVVGFTFVRVRDDATWGALVDNLHVHPDCKGQGIGRQLMQAIAREVAQRTPDSGLYLWVFADNTPSRAFYTAMGGAHVEYVIRPSPDGQELPEWRIAWSSPDALMSASR